MHGGVATSAPTGSPLKKRVMQLAAHFDQARRGDLTVTFQAQVVVAFSQHLVIDGTVRVMTGHTALAHRFVLEHMRARLLTVTLHTGFIHPTDQGA